MQSVEVVEVAVGARGVLVEQWQETLRIRGGPNGDRGDGPKADVWPPPRQEYALRPPANLASITRARSNGTRHSHTSREIQRDASQAETRGLQVDASAQGNPLGPAGASGADEKGGGQRDMGRRPARLGRRGVLGGVGSVCTRAR